MFRKYSIVLVVLGLMSSCEKVVDVDLDEGTPRLVVDASLNWYREYPSNTMESGADQYITLTKTAGFYDGEVPVATGATVTVTDMDAAQTFAFAEEGQTGIYACHNFLPVLGHTYQLGISYAGEQYTAVETLLSAPKIDRIEQHKGSVFDEDEVVLYVHYSDDADAENFYYFDYTTSLSQRNELSITSDRFTNGNSSYEILGYEGDDDDVELGDGDVVDLSFYAVSEGYYRYLDVLTYQIYTNGIFDPPPASVKGNVINVGNPDNDAFGYFRVAMGNKASVTLDETQYQ